MRTIPGTNATVVTIFLSAVYLLVVPSACADSQTRSPTSAVNNTISGDAWGAPGLASGDDDMRHVPFQDAGTIRVRFLEAISMTPRRIEIEDADVE